MKESDLYDHYPSVFKKISFLNFHENKNLKKKVMQQI